MKRYKTLGLFMGVLTLLVGIIFVYAMLWQDGGMKAADEAQKDNGALAVRNASTPH